MIIFKDLISPNLGFSLSLSLPLERTFSQFVKPAPRGPFWFHFNKVSNNRAPAEEKTAPAGPFERRDAWGPRGATSWPASFTNNLITHLSSLYCPPCLAGLRLGTPRAGPIVSDGANKIVQAAAGEACWKLILSNYTDIAAAFQRVIKIWPASSCFHSLMGRERKHRNWIEQIKC